MGRGDEQDTWFKGFLVEALSFPGPDLPPPEIASLVPPEGCLHRSGSPSRLLEQKRDELNSKEMPLRTSGEDFVVSSSKILGLEWMD